MADGPLLEIDSLTFRYRRATEPTSREFGTGKRTWLRELAYGPTDWLVLAAAVTLLVTVTALSLTGHTRLWVPDFLISLAG